MKIFRYPLLWVLTAIILAVFFYRPLVNMLIRNIFSVQLAAAVNASPATLPVLEQRLQDIPYPSCYFNWISGLIANHLGQIATLQMKLADFLECSSNATEMIPAIAPKDQVLAVLAVKLYPDDISALYWLAPLMEKNNPKDATALYERIVQIKPNISLVWCKVGQYYENNRQYQIAKADYLNCCANVDIGSYGCFGAGRMMEKLGDPQQAIEYYRLSKYPPALQRADQLEQQLQQP